MRGLEERVREHRPAVDPPQNAARRAARAQLMAAIEDEPAGLHGRLRARPARRRRGRVSAALVPALAVAVAVAVAVLGLALPGHHRRVSLPTGAGGVLAADGTTLPRDGGLAAALRARYRRQLAAGDTVRTFIDPTLERTADAALSRAQRPDGGRDGTVVALDPDTGAVRAMTSVHGAIAAAGTVGSTLDPFTALVALEDRVWSASERFDDTGKLCVPGVACLHDVGDAADGVLDVSQALAAEDAIFFEHLGLLLRGLGPTSAATPTIGEFGFGRTTGIDLPGESAGIGSRPTTPGLAAAAAAGQGYPLVTPVQLAVAYGALADGGERVVPRIAAAVVAPHGRAVPTRTAATGVALTGADLHAVRDGLRANAAGSGPLVGVTERTFARFPGAVHGLAATTQSLVHGHVVSEAWYAGYVPARRGRPPLVVVVAIPGGGFGAIAAAPVARQILSEWETGSPGPWRPGDSEAR